MYPDSPGMGLIGGSGINYAKQEAALQNAQAYREPTPRERAKLAVEQAQRRLADAERVMAIFDQHPELEELLTLLSRHGNF